VRRKVSRPTPGPTEEGTSAQAHAANSDGARDEDRNPRRGGSLARDKPISLPIETLKRR